MSGVLGGYLSSRAWRIVFVLDAALKSSLIYVSIVVTTLGLSIMGGLEPIVPIILVGTSLSILHFACLYIGARFVVRFKLTSNSTYHFLLLLVFANMAFVAILTAFMSLGGKILGSAQLSLLVALTNFIPIVLVAPIAWTFGVLTRPRSPTNKSIR